MGRCDGPVCRQSAMHSALAQTARDEVLTRRVLGDVLTAQHSKTAAREPGRGSTAGAAPDGDVVLNFHVLPTVLETRNRHWPFKPLR